MAKVTKNDLFWLCDQIKIQIDKRIPFETGVSEGKFLQTNHAGRAVWGDPHIFI